MAEASQADGSADCGSGASLVHHRRNRQVKPEVLRQRVRGFPRDALLQGIARVAAQEARRRNNSEGMRDDKVSLIGEGYLFLLAGICVTNCNNHRSKTVDDAAVEDLRHGLYNVWPPELDSALGEDAVRRFLSRVAYLQMPYQISQSEQLSRTLCLFGNDPRFGEPVFEDGRWETILGVSLEEFVKIAFIMYAGAIQNPGGISRETLLADNVRPVFEPIGAERALRVIDAWLARPVGDLARLGQEMSSSADDLWRFNSFYEWPIAILGDDTYVVPSPLGVLQRLGPQGLYFVGRNAVDADANLREFRAFTKALGLRFERYVGEQLRFIRHAQILPEIVYGNNQKSVDYFIETPEVLVLVEAKSVAPNIDTRSGIFPEDGDIERNIERGCDQITKSADLIEAGHPNFPASHGRPMRGLVVTREQYLNLPLPSLTDVVQPASIPTTVVSSQQLEVVIPALSSDMNCGRSLLGALGSDPEIVKTSLDPLPPGRNQLLAEIGVQWLDEHKLIAPHEPT